jgi:dihydropyrimidinase
MMLDLVISGGSCVLPSGTAAADIGVAGGKIAMIGAAGSLGCRDATVDATGKVVIPGGIDPHIHCLSPIRFPVRRSRNIPIRRRRSAAPRCSAAPRR